MIDKKVYFQVEKLRNLTTDINMLGKSDDGRIEAIEYDVDHICFEVDEKSCRKGQLVNVDGLVHMGAEELPFAGSGKIVDTVSVGPSRIKVVIQLHTYNKVVWQKFVLLQKQRQSKVDKLFKSMREDE